jgi:RNA polymerase-binding transcription factor DksA
MMDPQKITQQLLAFQKQSFENFQSVWQHTQTQTSTTVDRLMDQVLWIPKENRQLLESWRLLMKQERERFAAFVDRGFGICEEMLASSPKSSTTKTSKTNAA